MGELSEEGKEQQEHEDRDGLVEEDREEHEA